MCIRDSPQTVAHGVGDDERVEHEQVDDLRLGGCIAAACQGRVDPVSYTHLDVYKRQPPAHRDAPAGPPHHDRSAVCGPAPATRPAAPPTVLRPKPIRPTPRSHRASARPATDRGPATARTSPAHRRRADCRAERSAPPPQSASRPGPSRRPRGCSRVGWHIRPGGGRHTASRRCGCLLYTSRCV